MELQLNIIGYLLFGLALVHLIFPKYFNWEQELRSLSIINRQMMYVHSFFIAFVVLLIGILCITSASELLYTPLGKKISISLAIFWFVRLLFQVFGYSSKTWRGKKFETTVHIVFIFFWTYLVAVFLMTYYE